MHFLLITTRTEDPTLMISPEEEDPNFRLKEPSSAEKLLETWKKRAKNTLSYQRKKPNLQTPSKNTIKTEPMCWRRCSNSRKRT